MVSNRFWHIVSVVKERSASLSSRVASIEPIKNNTYIDFVNLHSQAFCIFHMFPQSVSHAVDGTVLRRSTHWARMMASAPLGLRSAMRAKPSAERERFQVRG